MHTLAGGENLELTTIVTRGTTDVLAGVVGTLQIPEILTRPVIRAVDEVISNVGNILIGAETFEVEIPVIGENRTEPGDQLKFRLTRPVLLGLVGSVETETEPLILTPDDIE